MPTGAKYVGRGRGDYGRWGNPFTVANCLEADFAETEAEARQVVTDMYRIWLTGELPLTPESEGSSWSRERRDWIRNHIHELAGLDLACWCRPPAPGEPDHCHAAVLLEFAAHPGRLCRWAA
jgi:hypothetical protein